MYIPIEYDFGRYERIKGLHEELQKIRITDDFLDFEKKVEFLKTLGIKEILNGNKQVSVSSLSRSLNSGISIAIREIDRQMQVYLTRHLEKYKLDEGAKYTIGGAFGKQLEFMISGSCNSPPPGQSVFGSEGTTRDDASGWFRRN